MHPDEILKAMLPYLEITGNYLGRPHEGKITHGALFLCSAVNAAVQASEVKRPEAQSWFNDLIEYRLCGCFSYRSWLREYRWEQVKHLIVEGHLSHAAVQQGRFEWLEDLIAEAKGLPRRVEGTLPIPERHP